MKIKTTLITPQTWQKRMAVTGGKDGSRARAMDLFPEQATNVQTCQRRWQSRCRTDRRFWSRKWMTKNVKLCVTTLFGYQFSLNKNASKNQQSVVFMKRLLDPEDLGHAVSNETRQLAYQLLINNHHIERDTWQQNN